jgi:TPP-dependent 2-oxoacid decarboxylase
MSSSPRPLEAPIDLTAYLLLRLKELGVGYVHGVAGDYNLTALDHVEECGMAWMGNCNELNAGAWRHSLHFQAEHEC